MSVHRQYSSDFRCTENTFHTISKITRKTTKKGHILHVSSFSYIQNYHYAFIELRFSSPAATNIAINFEEFFRVCQCIRILNTESTSDCKAVKFISSVAAVQILKYFTVLFLFIS